MSSQLRFDHILISVTDLEKASDDFAAVGFTVFPGGTHVHGLTHNALIVFADGSYIELIAPTDPALLATEDAEELASTLARFVTGDGFVGYALHSEQIEEDVAAMRARGLKIGDPVANGRLRLDGERLEWRSAQIDGVQAPFIITDVTPRVLRVQNDAHLIRHANGVTGFAEVITLVDRLDEGTRLYRQMLGAKEVDADSQQFTQIEGAESATFALATGWVTVVAPTEPGNQIAEYQAKSGNVPLRLSLHTSDPTQTGRLDQALCHGAWIELVA